MARFYDAIDGKRPLPVTSADSRRSLELVTAFYHSSSTHQEVVLPLGPEHPLYQSWVPAAFR
jgi:predicted dehydrogenase